MPEEYYEVPDELLLKLRENIINFPGIQKTEIGGPEPDSKRQPPIGGPEHEVTIVVGKPKERNAIVIRSGFEEGSAIWPLGLATHSCPHCHKPITISLARQ
jgi:hypothetical protein